MKISNCSLFRCRNVSVQDRIAIVTVVIFIAGLTAAAVIWGIYGDSMETEAGKIAFGLLIAGSGQMLCATIAMVFYRPAHKSSKSA